MKHQREVWEQASYEAKRVLKMKSIVLTHDVEKNDYKKHKDSIEFGIYFRENSCGGRLTKIHLSLDGKSLCGRRLFAAQNHESTEPSSFNNESLFDMHFNCGYIVEFPFCKRCLAKVTILEI